MESKEKIRVCPLGYCDGSGVVSCMDSVYAGEPHMAMVGERACECSLDDEDDYDEEDDDLNFDDIDPDEDDIEEDDEL